MVLHKLLGRKERFPTPEILKERGVKSEILTNDLSGNPVQQTPIPEAPSPHIAFLQREEEPEIELPERAIHTHHPHHSTEELQRIMEQVLSEKLNEFGKELDAVKKVRDDVRYLSKQMDERFEKLNSHLENLQITFEEKVDDHQQTVEELSVELKALKRVFDSIMPTFTDNIRQMRDIIENKK
ncbi:MAG: hypothetical protein AABW84_02300 [Nanoarchaeota archaeon]